MKRIIVLLLLTILLLTLTACDSKKDDTSDNSTQTTTEIITNEKGEEGYYDDIGCFWLTDGSGYYDTEGTFIVTKAAEAQEPTITNVFNDEVIGNYGDVSSANVIIEAGQASIKYEGAAYTIPSSAFSEPDGEGTDITYNFSMQDTGASGSLSFYEASDIPLSVEVIYTDNSGADLYFSLGRSYVLDSIPLEGYVSLDSQGEFGAIPMTEDVKKLLLEGMTEDYIIVYYPVMSVSATDNDGSDISPECGWYSIVSYDENGYDNSDCYSIDVYDFKTQSDADAFYKYENSKENKPEIEQSGTAVVERSYDDMITEFYQLPGGKSSKLQAYNVYEHGVVYGEHCLYDDNFDRYIYFSKPYTLEEGKVFAETTALMSSLFCYETPSSDGQYTLAIEGNIHKNSITIKDPNGYSLIEGTCVVKAEGDTLLAYKYDISDPLYTNVAELTLEGDSISVKCYRYEGTGEITYDNYKEAQAISEAEFVVPLP
jgi:hypothetical protein